MNKVNGYVEIIDGINYSEEFFKKFNDEIVLLQKNNKKFSHSLQQIEFLDAYFILLCTLYTCMNWINKCECPIKKLDKKSISAIRSISPCPSIPFPSNRLMPCSLSFCLPIATSGPRRARPRSGPRRRKMNWSASTTSSKTSTIPVSLCYLSASPSHHGGRHPLWGL